MGEIKGREGEEVWGKEGVEVILRVLPEPRIDSTPAAERISFPAPCSQLTSPPRAAYPLRRVLTMQWIDGVKLTTLPKAEIRALVKVRS